MRTECIRAIEKLALSDPQVVVIASDPGSDFMEELAEINPDRLMIEGICEQALIGTAAGLASEGYYPYIVTLAVFATRRCYEQLLLDFGLHRLSGCIVGTGGGLHYAPLGPTHLSVDDLMLVSAIPGAAVLAPGEPDEADQLVREARTFTGLSYIRLSGTTASLDVTDDRIALGRGRLLGESGPVLFISCGAATLAVQEAIDLLKQSEIQASAIHLHTVKPLDVALIRQCAMTASVVLCVEEHRHIGGLSSAVLHALTTMESPAVPVLFASIGVGDDFPFGYGSYEDLLRHYGITGTSLAERARHLLLKHTHETVRHVLKGEEP